MTTLKTTSGRNGPLAQSAPGPSDTASRAQANAGISRRSTSLDWEEAMLDYVEIEKRAQAMRSEAAWNSARTVKDWVVAVFRRGKAKAGSAAQASLERHGQPT